MRPDDGDIRREAGACRRERPLGLVAARTATHRGSRPTPQAPAHAVHLRLLVVASGLLAALGLAISPRPALATCNVIPGTVNHFRGALGAADRPFAMPGDVVELTVRPELCDGASLRVADHDGSGAITAADVLVTLLFEPPGGAARNAAIIASSCSAIGAKLATCQSQLGAGTVSCFDGPLSGLAVTDGPIDDEIRFRFPDTDAQVGTPSDDRTLAGPATIAVTPSNLPLPCSLAASRCADTGGLVACIDELYAIDGTCRTDAEQIDPAFGSFTALPVPNDFEAVCDTAGTPCDGTATEVRLTTDLAGNALIPFDYRGVLVRLDDVPVPRLVRASTSFVPFTGGSGAIRVPGDSFLGSFSPQGHRLPPLFTPLSDPVTPGVATLFGSIDAAFGVVRVARRSESYGECAGGGNAGLGCNEHVECPGSSCGGTTCRGGANDGQPCASDAACSGGECGPALFELRDRYASGIGPVVVAESEYDADAENPVPTDGLVQTPNLFAFVRSEALEDTDLNGDGDDTDPVLTLRDRETGLLTPIGAGGSDGRAATRIRQLPFQYAAMAAEDDLVAWLEPEPLQGDCSAPLACDANGNGNVFETILRVYRLVGASPQELTASPSITADAAAVVDGRSVVVTDGLVVWRESESARALQRTELVSVASNGTQGDGESSADAVTPDGRFVVFTSQASNLAPGGANVCTPPPGVGNPFPCPEVYLRDRLLGTTERVSIAWNGERPNWTTNAGAITPGGRYVAFISGASNLVPGDDAMCGLFNCNDVFVRDRCAAGGLPVAGCTPTTERVSVAFDGSQLSTSVESPPSLSPDGRFVFFSTGDSEVVPGDTNGSFDVFARDRCVAGGVAVPGCSPTTTRVSVDDAEGEFALGSNLNWPSVSPDGRFAVLFTAHDVLTDLDLWVRDLTEGTTTRVFVDPDTLAGGTPALTPGGRVLAFEASDGLVPGDTNGFHDLFVTDRCIEGSEPARGCSPTLSRASVRSDGAQLVSEDSPGSHQPSISEDGRFVAFGSLALTPGDTNTFPDVLAHDRLTGLTQALSVAGDGFPSVDDGAELPFLNAALTADGSAVLFWSGATDLVAGDQNGAPDVFLRGPDPSDCGSDLSDPNDCDLRDFILRVLDGRAVDPAPISLGPAKSAATAAGNVVFVHGEMGAVHLWRNRQTGAAVDLARRAEAVDLSASWIAALVSEALEGVSLNGDTDSGDQVVQVNPVPTANAASWINLGLAADTIQVVGSTIAFLVPESDQGLGSLNGDADTADRVLHVYDASTATLTNLGRAAEDFVLGERLLAFRTREAGQGAQDLNADGDIDDDVLGVLDLTTGSTHDTAQAVVPCRLEACDPRIPYRVEGDTVTYLTLEVDQGGQDLNGDDDAADLVLQVFNAAEAELVPAEEATSALAGASTGVCSDTGAACSSDVSCGSGATCFVPPGGCDLDLGVSCTPGLPGECDTGQYCSAESGTCHERPPGTCGSTADCTAPAVCVDAGQSVLRLAAPLAQPIATAENSDAVGVQVLSSSGVCIEDLGSCVTEDDCATGEFCAGGSCRREQGACRTTADCNSGTCSPDLTTATAADADHDGLADAIDNCAGEENADQADADGDGLGDACDGQRCGNGIREGDPSDVGEEECDDGNQTPGDGCDADCQREAAECADGFDNDGDGLVDYPTDPGCGSTLPAALEDPQCNNGRDDDFDGQVDYAADTKCQSPRDNNELTNPKRCGMGVELLLAVPLLLVVRKWDRSRSRERAAIVR